MGQKEAIKLRIRDIRSKHLGKRISVKGYLLDYMDVRPRIVSAKFKCQKCGTILSVLQIDQKFREPSRCSCGNKHFEELEKEMIDWQRVVLSEEKNRNNPHSEIYVLLKEELTDPSVDILGKINKMVSVVGELGNLEVNLEGGGVSTSVELCIDGESIR